MENLLKVAPLILSLIGIALGVLSFRYQQVRDKNSDDGAPLRELREEFDKLAEAHNKTTERVAKTETAQEMSWKMLELCASQILHHPVTPELDYFIDKNLTREGLTKVEAKSFSQMLYKIIKERQDDGTKMAASALLAVIVVKYKLDVIS